MPGLLSLWTAVIQHGHKFKIFISVWPCLTNLTLSETWKLYLNWRLFLTPTSSYPMGFHQWPLCLYRQMTSTLCLSFLAITRILNWIFLNVIIFFSSIMWTKIILHYKKHAHASRYTRARACMYTYLFHGAESFLRR
jgi:hypothetical protein